MAEQNENVTSNGRNGRGAVSYAEERVRDIGNAALHRAENYAGQAQERIDEKRDAVASNIEDVATRLRDRADAAGPIGHAAGDQVARQMEAAAGYLHTHQSNEIATDVITYVRRHPVRSTIIAFVIGYWLGRLLR